MTSSLGNSVQELSGLGLGGEVARGPASLVMHELWRHGLCRRGGAREGSGAVARRGWSTATWARGGRRRVMVRRARCCGLGCSGELAAAQARAQRIGHGGITKEDAVEWLNIPPNATEKETEKGVLKPCEIH